MTAKNIILLIFFTNIVFSQTQRADLVFKDGDIIEGFGMITNRKIKFRISKDDKPEDFTGLIVKEIIFYGDNESRVFEYVKTKETAKPILMEVICFGHLRLYQYTELQYNNSFNSSNNIHNTTTFESSTLYLKRENEEVATIVRGNVKKMKSYFQDCEIIQELFNSGEYRNLSKRQLVNEYNVFCTE